MTDRDLDQEAMAAEFAGWMEAQGYWRTGTEYSWDDMRAAFAAAWDARVAHDA